MAKVSFSNLEILLFGRILTKKIEILIKKLEFKIFLADQKFYLKSNKEVCFYLSRISTWVKIF
jgi:hypothetical protein